MHNALPPTPLVPTTAPLLPTLSIPTLLRTPTTYPYYQPASLARRSRVGKKAELVATALAATATKGLPAEQSSVRTGRTKKSVRLELPGLGVLLWFHF